MSTTVASFQIEYTRFLDPSGEALAPLPDFAEDPQALVPLYRAMVLTRAFDAKAISLQRTGRLGTYASSLGQEAVRVGLASAMAENDVFLPTYRDHGAMLVRGVTLVELFLYWGGDERGSDFAGPREDFPVCVFGDGATSRGDAYEAFNFAGAWRLPVVFVANNNQWAISVPRQAQTAADTLAQKAIAAGFPGEQVDGNDVIAVRAAVGRIAPRAAVVEGAPGVRRILPLTVTFDHRALTGGEAARFLNAMIEDLERPD